MPGGHTQHLLDEAGLIAQLPSWPVGRTLTAKEVRYLLAGPDRKP
jgi:hypothetical protein